MTGLILPLAALLLAAGCSSGPSEQQREDQFWTVYDNNLGAAAPTDPTAVAKLRADSVAYGQTVCTKVSQGMSPDDIVSQGGGDSSGETDEDLNLKVTTAIQYLCPQKS